MLRNNQTEIAVKVIYLKEESEEKLKKQGFKV